MGNSKNQKSRTPDEVVALWLERDLTADAAELQPAFEVDEVLGRVLTILAADRCPILAGERGVGKTAIVHELVRRQGGGASFLGARHVLQLSIKRRLSGCKQPEDLGPAMNELVEALLKRQDAIVPYFRDIHLAYTYDLEAHLQSLAHRFDGPMLGEGDIQGTQALLEYTPELADRFFVMRVEEPALDRSARLLEAWAEHATQEQGVSFTPDALELALHLAHRFLTRSRLPRAALDVLRQLAALSQPGSPVTKNDVVDRLATHLGVPRHLLDAEAEFDLAEVESRFRERVLGQPAAVEAVVRMLGLLTAGLSDVRRPLGAFLFAGPSGVGKTHVAQLLAEYLFGSRDRMVRFNMADYPNEWSPPRLFGDPECSGLTQRGLLTHRLMGLPFGVLLLDEFEKAHATVLDRFLQLIDEGAFINGMGEHISCRSMIIIATTNAGAEVHRGNAFGFTTPQDLAARERSLQLSLERHFRFELLNRFDQVVHFRPLSREDIRTLARRELEALRQRPGFRQRRLALEVDEAVLDWLAAHGYDADYGARFLRRTIERHVVVAVADAVTRHRPAPGATVELTVRRNGIVARVAGREEGVAPRAPAETAEPARGAVAALGTTDVRSAAGELLRRAAPRFEALQSRAAEHAELLARINSATFWDDRAARDAVLDRFRELDVAIRIEERCAQPIRRLEELLHQSGSDAQVAGALGNALTAFETWQRRMEEEGPAAVWMLIAQVDALHPVGRWVEDLTKMELAWCRRRLELDAAVVAFELDGVWPRRTILAIEGPGAAAQLAMEVGQHRLRRSRGADSRARILVIPRSGGAAGAEVEVRQSSRRIGQCLEVNGVYTARLALPQWGQTWELAGEHREWMAHAVADLRGALAAAETDANAVARVYNEDGSGARDPRTGATAAHLKPVLRGQLDPFLEAWRTGAPSARVEDGAA